MYRWIDHTAELEVHIESASEAGVFEDALMALAELLGEGGAEATAPVVRRIAVEAPDRAALLAAWLEELVFLAESEALVPVRLASLELGERELRAEVEARPGAPPHLVKAVTYHGLRLERDGDRWRAAAVLDV